MLYLTSILPHDVVGLLCVCVEITSVEVVRPVYLLTIVVPLLRSPRRSCRYCCPRRGSNGRYSYRCHRGQIEQGNGRRIDRDERDLLRIPRHRITRREMNFYTRGVYSGLLLDVS